MTVSENSKREQRNGGIGSNGCRSSTITDIFNSNGKRRNLSVVQNRRGEEATAVALGNDNWERRQ